MDGFLSLLRTASAVWFQDPGNSHAQTLLQRHEKPKGQHTQNEKRVGHTYSLRVSRDKDNCLQVVKAGLPAWLVPDSSRFQVSGLLSVASTKGLLHSCTTAASGVHNHADPGAASRIRGHCIRSPIPRPSFSLVCDMRSRLHHRAVNASQSRCCCPILCGKHGPVSAPPVGGETQTHSPICGVHTAPLDLAPGWSYVVWSLAVAATR